MNSYYFVAFTVGIPVAVNLRIINVLMKFYTKFPDARKSKRHRVSLGGRVSFGEAAEPRDPQTMRPEF